MLPEEQLNSLRAQIEQVDSQILQLLEERAAISVAIARCKAQAGLPVRSCEREREVLQKVFAFSRGKRYPAAKLMAIFKLLFAHSRDIQQKTLASHDPRP